MVSGISGDPGSPIRWRFWDRQELIKKTAPFIVASIDATKSGACRKDILEPRSLERTKAQNKKDRQGRSNFAIDLRGSISIFLSLSFRGCLLKFNKNN